MIITNKFSYPSSVVEACKASLYQPQEDTIRVTELIDSPLIKRLTIEHWKDLTIDCDEIVYSSLFGTAWHKLLEAYEPDAMAERRWYVMLSDNRTLTGQTDIFKPEEGVIEDNKTQSAYAFVFGTASWERQLNIYAHLIRKNGFKVRELWINAMLRDWSKYDAMKNKRYPKHKFHRVKSRLWSEEKCDKYIRERLDLIDNPDYVCSDEEKWRRKTQYAVMKKGTKKAQRVLDTAAEAAQWVEKKKPKGRITIVERKGGCVRCEDYCVVRAVCPYKDK